MQRKSFAFTELNTLRAGLWYIRTSISA